MTETAQATDRLRGVIVKTFHGKKYAARVKAGEQLEHDCGFIEVSGEPQQFFVNIGQVLMQQREGFAKGKYVEFTPIPAVRGKGGPAASRVKVL